MMNLTGLHYFGSKGRPELNRWIRGLLPDSYELYVEPYAGMLGVLLNRGKSRREIVNDLDGGIVNWWCVIRDKADEFKHKLEWTPNSEELYYDAYDTLNEGSHVDRAIKLTIVMILGRMQSATRRHFGYRIHQGSSKTFDPIMDQVLLLRDRMKHVVIRNVDAIELLERMANSGDAVIYCDPPYATADTSLYRVDVQHDLTDVLMSQAGKVAISGYNNEWDHLDWQRHELVVKYANGILGEKQPDRTEVLWTNYRAGSQLELKV